MKSMKTFFDGVGQNDASGIWEGKPNINENFRAHQEKKLEKRERARKAAEMI